MIAPKQAAEWARQVAVGLSAAHAKNLIHRDIKSANVLLTEAESAVRERSSSDRDGRVSDVQPMSRHLAKITDFGLARSTISDSERMTRADQFLGTPGYASPEQLAGEDVDSRSDIYSLGVVLYEMLTRTRPVVGTFHQIRRRIVEHNPVPPRRWNPEIPRDLETITLKCLRKEVDRRYQTAGEFADDLERFLRNEPILARPVSRLEKAWLLCRRRPVDAILSLSLAVVVVSGMTAVFAQWRRAEHGWSKAKVEGQRADHNFEETLTTLVEASEAHQRIAEQSDSITTHEDAARATQRVVQILARLVRDKPESFKFREDLARNYYALGRTLLQLGRVDEGIAAYRQAQSEWESLLREVPGSLDYEYGITLTQVAVAKGLDLENSTKELNKHRLRLERASNSAPLSARSWGLLGNASKSLGNKLQEQGDIQSAIALYDKALEAFQQSAAIDPADSSTLFEQGETWNNLGVAYRKLGKLKEAIQAYSNAKLIIDPLLRKDLGNKYFLNTLGRISINLGRALGSVGKGEQATVEFRKAVGIREQLYQIDPSDTEILSALANSYVQLANALMQLGQTEEGLSLYEKARDVVKPVAESNPKDLKLRVGLAQIYSDWAPQLQRVGRIDEAEASFIFAIAEYEALQAVNPTDKSVTQMLAENLNNLGELCRLRKDYDRCEELTKRSLGMLQQLVKEFPDNVDYQRSVASAQESLGEYFLARKSFDVALTELQRSCEIRQNLLGKNGDDDPVREELIAGLRSIGYLHLRHRGDAVTALTVIQDAQRNAEELSARQPENARWLFLNGACRTDAAFANAALGRDDDAYAAFREANSSLESVIKKAPEIAEYRDQMDEHLANFAAFQRKSGRIAESMHLTVSRRELRPGDAEHLFLLACELAQCVACLDEATDEATRLLRDLLAERTTEFLKEAVQRGLPNPQRLHTTDILKPLQESGALQAIIGSATSRADENNN